MPQKWPQAEVHLAPEARNKLVDIDVSGVRFLNVHTEGPSQPQDPKVDDTWTDTNSGKTFWWNGQGWVQEGFDPEHPVPDA